MEQSVAHGYLMARVEGYAKKRQQARRKPLHAPPQDWVSGLMRLSNARGAGQLAPAPSDSPVSGVTAESFRAEVAAMRAAEYERARGRRDN